MALDEVLFTSADEPTLRFYRWQQPSLSFGYFSRYADVEAEAPQRDLVRRWTGGGIVLHGTDVTYSLVVPHPYLPPSTAARSIYAFVHCAIADALGPVAQVELAAADAPKVSDACFANAVTADLLARGRKIAGAAQRRTRGGLLQQGSIQFDQLPPMFTDSFSRALCRSAVEATLKPDEIARATALAAAKYATHEWLHRH
jgi:lipoate-protein ligase A